jgi:hypothetical protein
MGSAELPVLSRSRMPAVSLEVTRGSSFADVRLSTLRPDSAPTPSVLATGEISPASFPVSAAGGPTRGTACAFSPAVSLGDDGSFARPSPVPLPWAVLSWLFLHPRRVAPGEPGGVIEDLIDAKGEVSALFRQQYRKSAEPEWL